MKKLLLLLLLATQVNALQAQLPPHLNDRMTYPVFDFSPWVGVVKSKAKALKYDRDLEYKVVIDVTDAVKDSTQIIRPLLEAARTYNLNIANGVPKRKMTMAVVVHGGAINAILNEEAYQEKYGVPNPNIEAIRALKKEGVDIYVCAQILSFRQVPEDAVFKSVDLAISARTALITLNQKGYSYINVNQD